MGAYYRNSFPRLRVIHSRMLTSRQRVLKTLSANLIQINLVVTLWSLFTCLNYVINPFVNLLLLLSNLVWQKALSQNEKSKCRTNLQKNDKQCVKNYRPVSLLPICSKVFEHIIYDFMFQYFIENNFISENQPGFITGDSYVNQL